MEKKLGTPIEILCKGFPSEFVTYLSYCRNLKFEDKPDYNYLRTLLKDLFVKSGYDWDYQYDWNIIAKKRKEEKKVEGKEEEKMVMETDISKNSQQKNTQGTDDKAKKEGFNDKNNFSLLASKGDTQPK